MGWPESDDSKYLWREGGEPARQAYANVAKAISQFEPLYMLANPGEAAANARKAFADAPNVTVLEVPINDGWTRDWGPSVRPFLSHLPGISVSTALSSRSFGISLLPQAIVRVGVRALLVPFLA